MNSSVDQPDSISGVAALPQRFLGLVLLPALVGTLTGLGVGLLSWVFEQQTLGFFTGIDSIWVSLVPVLALPLTILAMRYVTGTYTPSTGELYIHAYHDPEKRFPIRQVPGRLLAGGATVAFGGAQGLESPSTTLGSGIGSLLESRALHRRDRGFLMTAGASAGIAAIFCAPATGAMFGLEAPFRRGMDGRPIVQAAVAAVTSYAARVFLVGDAPLIPFATGAVDLDRTLVIAGLLLALACGVGARLFALGAVAARYLARHLKPFKRALVGGLLLVPIAALGYLLTDKWVTFGPGHVMIEWGLESSRSVQLLLLVAILHSLCTVICIFGGGGGGVFHALTAAGVIFGSAAGALAGRPEALVLPLLGGACFLSAAYRIPLAGIMLVVEWGGGIGVVMLGFVGVAIAQACMAGSTIAPAQADSAELNTVPTKERQD